MAHRLKKNWFADTAAYLIFDDTVINNELEYNLELTRLQYSGNEHDPQTPMPKSGKIFDASKIGLL